MKKFIAACKKSLHNVWAQEKKYWSAPKFVLSALLGLLMLTASLMINFSAGQYSDVRAGNAVKDIILDNLPVIRTGFIFTYGALLMWVFVFVLLIANPKSIPFTLKSVALLIVIRSLFVIMTHLGPYPDMTAIPQNGLLDKFSFGADYFFSGHTAFPFLLCLIYWHDKRLRAVFLAAAVIFAASVLLGHLHYSIDVFAAFFITYTVYEIAAWVFTNEYEMLYDSKPSFLLKK